MASQQPQEQRLKVSAVGASGNDGNLPQNVLDGNLSTRWSCLGKGSWIQLDLGSDVPVNQVRIAWYNGNTRRSNYVIDLITAASVHVSSYSGVSSGTTTQLESYTSPSTALPPARYVKITVNGNTANDWASMTEVQVWGPAAAAAAAPPTPTPTPTPPPTSGRPGGLDPNGVMMIYPSATMGPPAYYYQMSDNIQSSKYVRTDGNYSASQKTEGNITYKRLTAGDVHYASSGKTGKTCRVNVNAGGFVSTQAHTWKDSGVKYIWTANDSKNAELTYYFRVVNMSFDHTSCSTKMHGGIHTGSGDPRSSCIEMCFFIGGSNPTKMEAAYEYSHPNYSFESVTTNSPNKSKANTWIGRKTAVWTGKDGKVHSEDWIDWTPFDSNGKPANNWTKLMSKTFGGTSSNSYSKVPDWGGMSTIRIDGYQYIDISILSIREITPPS